MKPRILFLIHSASQNGATILLLHLLGWLKGRVDWEIEVLVHGSGPLLDEIRSVAPTTVWRSPASLLPACLRHRMTGLQLRLEIQCLKALLVGRRYDLIYANTVAVWPLVKALSNRAPALLWHIHELVYALRLSTGEQGISELFQPTSRFVVVSNSVRDALSREFNLGGDRMDLLHGFIPASDLRAEELRDRRERVRRDLGWPADVFVVGGCGSLGWRKGTDLFLQIARSIGSTKGYEKARFLWVGGGTEDKEALEFAHDLRALGLEGRCCRVPATTDVLRYYSAMDVLALTSREDPFPLVMLEAGSHGIPVVCFADSGGGPEFVGEDAGLIAPYLDLAVFAAHLRRLQDAPDLRERLGAAASAKVRTRYSVESQAPKLLKIIEKCLPQPAARATRSDGGRRLIGWNHPGFKPINQYLRK
jgi:glycosyltransferase involved in cell wall biosynthesis